MLEALEFEFFRNAVMAGLLASVICGIMGTLVVVNRIVFLSGGIAHAAYGGIGLAFFFGWPYLLGTLGFSLAAAMMMAAVDGVRNRISPGEPLDRDIYEMTPEELAGYDHTPANLECAIEALAADREFLTAGGVFTDDMLDAYIDLKMEEVTRLRMTTHPVEFDLYYSL